jgi:ribonucleases P/MRP protein subunit RPP40
VGSGVPQGTVLGPCLFNIFIDDIDECTVGETSLIKFADDTKSWRVIEGEGDRKELQQTLDNLCAWAHNWGMQFNESKCRVMHLGNQNPKYEYTMNGQKLLISEEEKDVGVYVNTSLKPGNQCKKAATKATQVLKQIMRNFHYRDKTTFVKLYQQYVRPHLEFASPAWAPWQAGDKATLECVQEKAVRQIVGLKGNTYEEKCSELGLETLEKRRYLQDMAQTFKIIKGIDKVRPEEIFKFMDEGGRTRAAAGHKQLQKKMARTEARKNSYTYRVVDQWNSLPEDLRMLERLEAFKKRLKNVDRQEEL